MIAEKVTDYMEEMIDLAMAAKEARDGSAESSQLYNDLFMESIVSLDGYLSRKEIADIFSMTENALNVAIFRYKSANNV